MRIVFMGSPAFALPSLRALVAAGHDVAGVFTQPDRPVGRGRSVESPPVKQFAIERGLPIFQPERISAPEIVEQLRALAPDAGVIAAYGQVLRQPVLDAPRLGVLNVHASLLPRWRGAAPVPAAILAGDERSGATIMKVVRELDAGPILAQTALSIGSDETAGALTERIAEAGAALLVEVLPRYAAGRCVPQEQDAAQVTYAPQLKKTDALIDCARIGAEQIARMVRAYNPWPMAYAYLDGKPLRIVEAFALQHRPAERLPGTIFPLAEASVPASFGVATCDLDLGVVQVQPSGGRVMTAAAFLQGRRDIIGKRLTAG